ncbi:MAG: sugar O-acetyltransferase precursor [Flavipsychrobacter sp.]|nr:sugar O-acetyltransferase precursor [Flavipsychrobacter sp.]
MRDNIFIYISTSVKKIYFQPLLIYPQHKIKQGLFIMALATLCLPLIQQCLPFADEDGLFGYYNTAGNVSFSFATWFDGSYQQKKDAYLNDHMGFRPGMVRIKDQVSFSLFSKAKYGGAILGKHNYLYYENYILAYNGRDYTGEAYIRHKMLRLKALQDTFAHMGKSLILAFTPNKAFFYPQNIPDSMRTPPGPTNYKSYVRMSDSLSINFINFNEWLLAMKDTSSNVLYPIAGTHWSVYSSIIAGDSLVRYIERTRNIRMPHAVWTKVGHLYGARQTDDDIVKAMNLMWPVAKEQYTYPELMYPADTSAKKPRVILIGDSFVINLLNNRLPQNSFTDWQFWFYFKYLNNANTPIGCEDANPLIEQYDWKAELDKTDCVVLMYTSINLTAGRDNLGNGFIEQAYDHYFPAKSNMSIVKK